MLHCTIAGNQAEHVAAIYQYSLRLNNISKVGKAEAEAAVDANSDRVSNPWHACKRLAEAATTHIDSADTTKRQLHFRRIAQLQRHHSQEL